MTRTASRTRTVAGALLASATMTGALLTLGGPAQAYDPGTPSGADPVSTGDPAAPTSGPRTGTVGSCSVVSSPSFLGLSCGSGSGSTLTPKQILGKDPVPDCWHEPLSQAELTATGYENSGDTTWYWERCLKGIDPKTKEVEPGGIRFTIGIVALTPDQVKDLTPNQQELVDFNDASTQVPSPVAVTSPATRPRVQQAVSFFNGTEDEVTASAGAVSLVARVSSIEVEPLGEAGPDSETLVCDGNGYKAAPGETPENTPEGCWYRYPESSAGEPLTDSNGLPAYPVVITATWQVSTVVGGVETPFNSFEKSQVTALPVTEVQSIVIN